jgi:plastocyanin
MKRLLLLSLPLAALALSACGSSSSGSSTASSSSTPASSSSSASASTPAAGGTVSVSMKNIAFDPASLNAKVGQTVVFTNNDTPPHNVTYVSGPKFTSSSTINPGGTFSLKLTKAGTIHYVCTIHPNMTATITVSP